MHQLHADKSFTLSFFTSAEFLHSACYVMVIFDLQIDPGLWLALDLAMSTEPLIEGGHNS